MTLRITCPHCSARLSAPDRAAGKDLPCPRCGKSVTVRAAQEPPLLAPAAPHLGLSLLALAYRAGVGVGLISAPPSPPPAPRPPPPPWPTESRGHSPLAWGFQVTLGILGALLLAVFLVCGGLTSVLTRGGPEGRPPPASFSR